ncbi:hypothetical protein HYV49_06275 [Candidatus Pacearchaeota archaeon]|nr:hypothetical protein [Candidatus Pacearchaeota archaeon]
MDCFIKKIFSNHPDEFVHRQFVRFGKGKYEQRAVIELRKGNKIKLNSTFEYANDLVNLLKEFPAKFLGIILAKDEIPGLQGKKKSGLYEYEINMNSQELKKINNYYFQLLDAEGDGIKLRMKKKLPKPGSGEKKIDSKFCVLEADLKYWPQIKECFFWDLLDGIKKAAIRHTYIINEIVMPEQEKDPEKLRTLAKRKGTIIRLIESDSQILNKEHELNV